MVSDSGEMASLSSISHNLPTAEACINVAFSYWTSIVHLDKAMLCMRYVQIFYPANSTASVARGSQSHFEMTATFSVLGLEEDKGIKVHLFCSYRLVGQLYLP